MTRIAAVIAIRMVYARYRETDRQTGASRVSRSEGRMIGGTCASHIYTHSHPTPSLPFFWPACGLFESSLCIFITSLPSPPRKYKIIVRENRKKRRMQINKKWGEFCWNKIE